MRSTKGTLLLVLALPLLLASCSRGKEERHRIAVVNDAPIYLDDFHREVAIAAERDPAFSVNQGSLKAALDKMVEKRLLIQEAKKRGITEDERFIVTIKAFWEQTLIQRLMEELNSELSAKVYVTDEEVRRHYERMGVRVTLMTVRSISEAEAVKVKALMEGGKPVEGAEELGPLFLEDIGPSSPLKGAFDLAPGSAGVWTDPLSGGFLTAMVVKRETAKIRPFDEITAHIKAELLERKKQEALSEWLGGVKKGARVTIDAKLFERIADE